MARSAAYLSWMLRPLPRSRGFSSAAAHAARHRHQGTRDLGPSMRFGSDQALALRGHSDALRLRCALKAGRPAAPERGKAGPSGAPSLALRSGGGCSIMGCGTKPVHKPTEARDRRPRSTWRQVQRRSGPQSLCAERRQAALTRFQRTLSRWCAPSEVIPARAKASRPCGVRLLSTDQNPNTSISGTACPTCSESQTCSRDRDRLPIAYIFPECRRP